MNIKKKMIKIRESISKFETLLVCESLNDFNSKYDDTFKGPGYYVFVESDYDLNVIVKTFYITNSSKYRSIYKLLLKGHYEPLDKEYTPLEWYEMLKIKENESGTIITSKQSSPSSSNFIKIFNSSGIIDEEDDKEKEEKENIKKLFVDEGFSRVKISSLSLNEFTGSFKYNKTKWSFTSGKILIINEITNRVELDEKTIWVKTNNFMDSFLLAIEALKNDNWDKYEGFKKEFNSLYLGDFIEAKNIQEIENIYRSKTNEEKIKDLKTKLYHLKVVKGILNSGVDFKKMKKKEHPFNNHNLLCDPDLYEEYIKILINAGLPSHGFFKKQFLNKLGFYNIRSEKENFEYLSPDEKEISLLKFIRRNDIESVKKIINLGVDVNKAKYNVPILLAADKGFNDIVEILINAGADVNIRYKVTKHSSLLFAALQENIDLINILIKAGAKLTQNEINILKHHRKDNVINMLKNRGIINEALKDILKPKTLEGFYKGKGLYVACVYDNTEMTHDKHQFTSFQDVNNENEFLELLDDINSKGGHLVLKFVQKRRNEIYFSEGNIDTIGFEEIK